MTRDILRLAWPVLVGQLAVMANGVIDTVMAGRLSPVDLAAVGLGASVYISVYIGLMGILLALSPIVAQHWGAGRLDAIGEDVAQGFVLAGALSVLGCAALVFHDTWLALAAPPADVARRTSDYLLAIAAGLPAALVFRVFYALNTAISRPKAVMAINLLGLALKIPLNALFMHGLASPGGLPDVPALGGAGCAVATALIAWVSAAAGLWMLRRDPLYRRMGRIRPRRIDWPRLGDLLRLGIPIGMTYVIEVTAFTFISIFVARFGAVVAGSQQIASNLVGVAYMFPLALANATSVLAAQALGARDPSRARRVAARGIRLGILSGLLWALILGFGRDVVAGLYTRDAAVAAATTALLPLVAAYHLFDALQVTLAFVLRAWKIATLPMVVYALSLWGVGLGGGWLLTFTPWWRAAGLAASPMTGAQGFWAAGVASVVAASAGLAWVLRSALGRR